MIVKSFEPQWDMETPGARLAWMARRKGTKWLTARLRARVRHLRGGDRLLQALKGLDMQEETNDQF